MPNLTKVFGIDLGTTYSAVAYIDEFDRAVIVPMRRRAPDEQDLEGLGAPAQQDHRGRLPRGGRSARVVGLARPRRRAGVRARLAAVARPAHPPTLPCR